MSYSVPESITSLSGDFIMGHTYPDRWSGCLAHLTPPLLDILLPGFSVLSLAFLPKQFCVGLTLSFHVFFVGFWAQVKLVERGGKLIHEGQSVTLTCTASGLRFKDFAMSWHRSSFGGSKKFVASISAGRGNNKEVKEKMKGRAFIMRKNEANTVSLIMHQLKKEDSGTYYCATIALLAHWENFGHGTEVTVLPRDETQLEESGGGSHPVGKTLSLQCQASGFLFNTSQLSWYLWVPGGAPLWLTSLDHRFSKVSGDRITSRREDTNSQIFLQIKNLSLRDSGYYHCARRMGYGGDTDKLIFGSGTHVTVEPGPRDPLSPSVFVVRSQDAVACLVSDFYPKEIDASLSSLGASVSAQAETVAPTIHGVYSAIQIGKAGDNDSVTCSVKHLGKETHESHQPDTGIIPQLESSCSDQELTAEPEQRNQIVLRVLGLRLLLMKTVAINILFTIMALIF
ncbi:tyrosine-protein phosphatase non-receptor type substrate 1 [Monodelphis domestica]|uniref:tyrosine-protein phosphatase non-receptor type substrate 1 n=1 Tax=Monodelphis domestica TaxID=13616 RepID=UPI0024E1B8F2|nr:tyrosine-protein phosphatase non-receptor type substrate 1 [Monodelphis domestica]